MAFYKGTNVNQDGRFMNADKKLIEKMKIPPEYKIQIHKNKINLTIIKSWINKKLNDILGFEDDTLTNFIINLIEEYDDIIDPKKIQYSITGFLDDKTYTFMEELWKILISAQNTINGIPEELIEEKKKEIIQDVHNKYKKMKFLDDLIGKKDIISNNNSLKENNNNHYYHSESKKYKRDKDKYKDDSREKYYRERSRDKYEREREKYYRERRNDKYDKRDYHHSHHHRRKSHSRHRSHSHSHSSLYKNERNKYYKKYNRENSYSSSN